MRTRTWFAAGTALVLALGAAGITILRSQMERGADSQYDTRVATPRLAERRPHVLFDHGHGNTHSIGGRYRPFAQLLASDGCRVRQTRDVFDAALLDDADLLVVVNARGSGEDPTASAFTNDECNAVERWVRDGGALLLVADHHPYGEAAAALAVRFGVDMSGGWTDDSTSARAGAGDPGQLVFTVLDEGLGLHVITHNEWDPVDTVETFTGQSLLGPPGAAALLALAPTSVDRIPVSAAVEHRGSKRITTFETTDRSAAGRSQGLAFAHGRGRVVVLAEAAMLTAQRDGRGTRFGMNAPGNDNRAFALNVVRWLVGVLGTGSSP